MVNNLVASHAKFLRKQGSRHQEYESIYFLKSENTYGSELVTERISGYFDWNKSGFGFKSFLKTGYGVDLDLNISKKKNFWLMSFS